MHVSSKINAFESMLRFPKKFSVFKRKKNIAKKSKHFATVPWLVNVKELHMEMGKRKLMIIWKFVKIETVKIA